jgi:hypothetical protein
VTEGAAATACEGFIWEREVSMQTGSDVGMLFAAFALGCDGVPARERFLKDNPVLLEPEAEPMIDRMVETASRGSATLAVKYRVWRNCIRLARRVGIQEAFVQFATPPEEIVLAINGFFRTSNDIQAYSFLSAFSTLDSKHWAINVFRYEQAAREGNEERTRRMEILWDLLRSFHPDVGPPILSLR